MDPPETRYAKSDGLSIAYQVLGDGPTDVVCVLGFVTNIELLWDLSSISGFFGRLARFSRLVLFDKRGTGLSDRVALDQLPSLEQRMDDLAAVMDAAESHSATLLGFSEGGPLSILFAATHPDRVDGLICYGSYARRVDAVGGSSQPLIDQIETDWGTGKVLSARGSSSDTTPTDLSQVARFERLSATPAAAAAVVRMADQIDVTPVLPTITVPTLILHRSGDQAIGISGSRALAAGIGDATLVELDGSDHDPSVGDSDAVVREIERFVTGSVANVGADRVLATVVFTDIANSTELVSQLGDSQWRQVLDNHDRIVRTEITRFRGREIKTLGDGFMISFDGPARGIQCAQAIINSLASEGLEVRAGLHTGECELRGDDLGGIAVHVAARIASLATAGQVLVSRTVTDLVAGSGLTFTHHGDHTLKGVEGSWPLFVADAAATKTLP